MSWLSWTLWTYAFLGLVGIIVYMVAELPPSPDASMFTGLEFAHRGDSLSFPENTLTAIEGAHKKGAKAVEVDVMFSKDGVPIVIHDSTVDRTTNGTGLVSEMTVSELKQLRIKNLNTEEITDITIPTLEDVIKLTKKLGLKLEIELKTEVEKKYPMAQAIQELFEKYDLFKSAFVSSFDLRFLYYLRSENPKIIAAVAIKPHPPYTKLLEFMLRQKFTFDFWGIGIIEPNQLLADERFIKKWLGRGIVINVWTVNSPRAKAFYRQKNVSITSDCPGSYC